MHSLEQALQRPAEAEVESSPTEDSVAPVEKEGWKRLERAAFLLGRVRRPSVLVRYSELRSYEPLLLS
jgi:hypothetical protein